MLLVFLSVLPSRGSQSSIGSFGHPILVTSVDLVQAETGLSSLTD